MRQGQWRVFDELFEPPYLTGMKLMYRSIVGDASSCFDLYYHRILGEVFPSY